MFIPVYGLEQDAVPHAVQIVQLHLSGAVSAPRSFNFDDTGPHIGKPEGCGGAGQILAKVQDNHIFQRFHLDSSLDFL